MLARGVAWSPTAWTRKPKCLVEFSEPASVIAIDACIAFELLALLVVTKATAVKIAILDIAVCCFHCRSFVR